MEVFGLNWPVNLLTKNKGLPSVDVETLTNLVEGSYYNKNL